MLANNSNSIAVEEANQSYKLERIRAVGIWRKESDDWTVGRKERKIVNKCWFLATKQLIDETTIDKPTIPHKVEYIINYMDRYKEEIGMLQLDFSWSVIYTTRLY